MRLMTLTVALVLASHASAQDVRFVLTGDNTKIAWTGTKAAGKHEGGFKSVTGSATQGVATGLKLDVEIDTTSLYSDDAKLTGHLKGPDFFAVGDHPKAKFVSTKIDKADKGFTVNGNLTLLGKTKEIHFPAEIASGDTLSLRASFAINRSDFGMNYGKGQIDDAVSLQVTINATKK